MEEEEEGQRGWSEVRLSVVRIRSGNGMCAGA